MKKLILILFISILLVGCGSPSNEDKDTSVVRVGIVGSDSKTWTHIKEEAAKEGIDVQLIFFDSYPLPNRALDNSELELNAFQHHIYFDQEVEELGYDLSVLAETVYAPLGLYSKKISSLDEVKDGDTIVIPDDATNGGRALLLLEKHGFIKLKDDVGQLPTKNDIETYLVDVEILELAANNTPSSLNEVALAAINSGIATDAGLVPPEDAIVLEEAEPGNNPYINIIAVRTEDKDNPIYKRIVELYHTDAVKKIIEEDSKGASIPVW